MSELRSMEGCTVLFSSGVVSNVKCSLLHANDGGWTKMEY